MMCFPICSIARPCFFLANQTGPGFDRSILIIIRAPEPEAK
jgi:hypothetical protein